MQLLILVISFFCFQIIGLSSINTLPQGLGVPILLYHAITESDNSEELYTISKQRFRDHLGAMKLGGYQTIRIQDLYAYFYANKPLPEKSVMITFDQATKENYSLSDPILEELGFQAVMFVTTLMPNEQLSSYLSWEELREMLETDRWDIQANGFHYHNLIQIDKAGKQGGFGSNLQWLKNQDRLETIEEFKQRLLADLEQQKNDIETNIPGTQVIAFAYPFGDWGGGSLNLDPALAIAINYQAVNMQFSLSFSKIVFDIEQYRVTTTPHLIARFLDHGLFSPLEILQLLQRATYSIVD